MLKKLLGAMSVRIFLITVIGILLTATVVSMLGQRDSRVNESRLRDQFAFDRIESMIRILEITDAEKRSQIQDVFKRMGSSLKLGATPPKDAPALPAELENLHALLVPEIADFISITPQTRCSSRNRPPAPPPPDFGPTPPHLQGYCLAVYTHLQDHTPVLIQLRYGGHRPPPGHPPERNPLAIVLALLGLISIIWVVASVATQPLRKLANAALQLARNIENPPLPENQGSTEVRHAAKAFNEMQRSILKHVQERGFILGAIAHDLQTPLTRLRLRLEKVKDPELKQSLVNDLTATQEMVREGLDFARLCSENIDKNRVDLAALATAVCDNFEEAGHTIHKTLPDQAITIMGSAHLLTRCLNNLLSNAINYAQSPTLTIQVKESRVLCVISDDGPGIPEQELDNVLEPFRRLEDSRSRHTGGTGLGLSIARMIIEKHGGNMTLTNKQAPASGLVVQIDLPLN
ncbi:MAG TPA: ATP-binding protein [Methylophilus sp.]|uniref:ATP-binding protein n=1 Tax=Methylophilus sp. TaxID=29541 RepID=UPI002C553484|nr:ATP-binding protein [Methylophilus sp.]HSH87342.1 ATP-binding protein [Methylophilus sp.]